MVEQSLSSCRDKLAVPDSGFSSLTETDEPGLGVTEMHGSDGIHRHACQWTRVVFPNAGTASIENLSPTFRPAKPAFSSDPFIPSANPIPTGVPAGFSGCLIGSQISTLSWPFSLLSISKEPCCSCFRCLNHLLPTYSAVRSP